VRHAYCIFCSIAAAAISARRRGEETFV